MGPLLAFLAPRCLGNASDSLDVGLTDLIYCTLRAVLDRSRRVQ